MTAADRLERALREAAATTPPALVAYFTAGYPRRDGFAESLACLCAAADVLEVGVPFSDPMADGVSIQRASQQALEAGVSLAWILDQLAARPREPQTPVVLMSYLNPLLVFGFDRLARRASASRVSGFVVPDLPFEESEALGAALDAAGIALVQLVSPLTPEGRLIRLCAASRGFVYAVTSVGTTGRADELPEALPEYLARVRSVARVPVCAGFGIRRPAQVRRIAGQADGVVVGSAIVEAMERGEDPGALLRALRATSAESAAG